MTTALSLILLMVLIVGLVWAGKRIGISRSMPGHEITILGSLQLGPRERVCVVRVGQRQLLLGVTAHSINALTPIEPLTIAPLADGDGRGAVVVGSGADAAKPSGADSPFARVWARIKANAANSGSTHFGWLIALAASSLLVVAPDAAAQAAAGVGLTVNSTTNSGGTTYTVPIQTLLVFTALSFLPAIVLLMSSFTRIIIVLSLLRQAIGLQTTPPNQVLIGIALFLSFFVMGPTLDRIHAQAYKPYAENKISFEQALDSGAGPLRAFMLKQTRATDLTLFARMAKADPELAAQQMPLRILVPAFVTSELKTAFQIGFLVFVPFLIIDLIVASVLMSMGMMMLSPVLVALPFKLMLFVLADGWGLLLNSIVDSFGAP